MSRNEKRTSDRLSPLVATSELAQHEAIMTRLGPIMVVENSTRNEVPRPALNNPAVVDYSPPNDLLA